LSLILPFCVTACLAQTVPNAPQDAGMKTKDIEQVLREQREWIMAVPGVVGAGIGLCGDRPCIKVYSSEPASALAPKLPRSVDGYAVDIEVTGPIRALPEQPEDVTPTGKHPEK
jgi:hypothetical protein